MNDLEHALMMLESAGRDLKAIQGMTDSEAFTDEIFGFHVQQVIEKSLKAWIAAIGEEFPLTHNLGRLLRMLEDNDHDVASFWELIEYTAFAVEFRYGVSGLNEEPVDRQKAIEQAKSIFEHVKAAISRQMGS